MYVALKKSLTKFCNTVLLSTRLMNLLMSSYQKDLDFQSFVCGDVENALGVQVLTSIACDEDCER